MAMLEARNLGKHFGGVAAINGLSLSVEQGELRGVIGPNGAGKTTLFNVISGIYRPTKGEVLFEGERIDGRPASEIARRGLVRTFQRDALIHDFTVIDNVTLGRHLHAGQGLWGSVFGSSRGRLKARRRAEEILEFVGLAELREEMAADLAHGLQRVLGIAIALATEPRLLMLDEPVAGMNNTETAHMTEVIRKVHDDWGVTIMLVEHDMKTVMGLCKKISVLDFGEKLAEGLPEEIRNNPKVIEAYLGAEDIVA